MPSPSNGSNDFKREPILDGPDEAAPRRDDTIVPNLEAPREPLPLTIDFQSLSTAEQEASPIARGPMLSIATTLVEATPKPDGPGSADSVRHSVAGFEILNELGRGGMGVVYRARQKDLNRMVALKMILSGDHAGAGERERFRREAEAVAALQHPNIVQIFEIGEAEGRPYLAFEYIEGGSLANDLTGTPWPSRAAAALVETLAHATQFAHERGIVHRDLKPGNILLSGVRGTTPKITDFGLAKKVEADSSATGELGSPPQTRTGAVMGTPSYIAPEQAAGKNRDVGPLADVYALGAILYELLTGRPPFRGETALDTVLQVMSDDPVPPRRLHPKVPRDLETICLKCLQKPPAKRYGSARELAEDLRRFLSHEPIAARPIGSRERFVKWAKRHPAAATSLFGSLFALVTMLGISFYFNFALRQSAEAKELEAAKAIRAQKSAEESATSAEESEREMAVQKRHADDSLAKFEVAHQESLEREEEARRSAYALALNRASGLAERDPQRAARLLDSNPHWSTLRDFTWYHLRSLCRVEEKILAEHLRTVTHIAFSADGSLMATASWDGSVRIWDVRTARAVATLDRPRANPGVLIRRVVFAGPRTLVTAGNDRRVRFWDLPTALPVPAAGAAVAVILPWAAVEAGDVHALAVSPDESRLAAGSGDGKIRLWKIPALPKAGMLAVGGGMFSFALRAPPGTVLENGPAIALPIKPIAQETLSGPPDLVTTLVWTKDGLYSGGFDKTVRLWNPGGKSNGEIILRNADPILSFDLFPEAGLIALSGSSTDDATVRLWNFRQNREMGRLRGHTRTVYSVAFAPSGAHLATASHDGTVRLWDIATGLEHSVFRSHKEPVRCVVFSPDGRYLASGGQDSTVHLLSLIGRDRIPHWSLSGKHDEALDLPARAPFVAAAANSDGRVLALAEKDGSIKVWRRVGIGPDFAKTHSFVLKGLNGRISALAVSPAGDRIAAAADPGNQWTVGIWNIPEADAKMPIEVNAARGWKAPAQVYGLALHDDRLATAGEGGLQVWNLKTNALHFQPNNLRSKPRSVAFTADGKYLVSAGGLYIQVWDVETGKDRCTLAFGHRHLEIYTVAVGPPKEKGRGSDHWTVITSDESGTARIWDMEPAVPGVDGKPVGEGRSIRLVERAALSGHAEPIVSVSFGTQGKTIATASEDRTIRLWDPHNGQERATLVGHNDSLLLAAFLPEDTALLSVGRDGSVKLWHGPK